MLNTTAPTYRRYKSFTSVSHHNRAPAGEPSTLEIRRYPKYAEFRVHTGWFSESRGAGYTTARKVQVKDADVLARVDAVLARPQEVTGLFPLIDTLAERLPDFVLLPLIQRWFALAQSDNLSKLIDNERRDRAFADKPFAIGDTVRLMTVYGGDYNLRGTVVAEAFDSRPFMFHEWRLTVRWADGTTYAYPQGRLIAAE
jgi:hypothetical protein